MFVDGLLIPELLIAAIQSGRWPRNADGANRQNSRSQISEDRVRQLAENESACGRCDTPNGCHIIVDIFAIWRLIGAVENADDFMLHN